MKIKANQLLVLKNKENLKKFSLPERSTFCLRTRIQEKGLLIEDLLSEQMSRCEYQQTEVKPSSQYRHLERLEETPLKIQVEAVIQAQVRTTQLTMKVTQSLKEIILLMQITAGFQFKTKKNLMRLHQR